MKMYLKNHHIEKMLDNLKKEAIELNDNGCQVTMEIQLPDEHFFVVTPFDISKEKLIQCPKCKKSVRVDYKYCVFCGSILTPPKRKLYITNKRKLKRRELCMKKLVIFHRHQIGLRQLK